MFIFRDDKTPLKKLVEFLIKEYVQECSSIVACEENSQEKELEEINHDKLKILGLNDISGIEAQWLILVTGTSGLWTYEHLSRARNRLAIIIDTSTFKSR